MEFYRIAIETILAQLSTSSSFGLSHEEVKKRQKEQGCNVLPDVKKRTIFSIFISQFQDPLIYILVCAAIIIFIFGQDRLDAFIISGVLCFNAILGTVQESRTKNIIESLKRFIKTESVVLRDGKKIVVEDQDLVVGDIIFLKEGQRIPADARIIESNSMAVDESVLTGESQTVKKNNVVITEGVVLGDQLNMLFKGTYVVMGSGIAVVVAIGENTEIGKIHVIAEQITTEIPLHKELEVLSYWILIFIVCVCVLLFGIGVMMGKPINELLVMLTALFICVVPEGLPVVLTLVLVSGALQMAKQRVLVKNMQAVETLGRTDVIVIDKTGTLTRNEMVVSRVWADDGLWQITGQGYHSDGAVYHNGVMVKQFEQKSSIVLMALAARLLNSAEVIYQATYDLFDIKGDPTEAALFVFSQKLESTIGHTLGEYKKIYEIPFSSDTRYHAGFYEHDGQCAVFITGSPEVIMEQSIAIGSAAQKNLENFFDDGLRVIAVGMKTFPLTDIVQNNYEQVIKTNIQFLGLCGIEDSIRPEVSGIIQEARNAGLSIVMATGDHQRTALYVAERVGIYRSNDDYIDGSEIDTLTDEQLLQKIPNVTVFSRVSAEHKMRIIALLQRLGKIVAMTGDGINDAPSLVRADLGIAMGSIGTEVAKQAADIVLLNDSFVNIVYAIEQGRHIFYTLKRVVLYFFATNMGEILIVLFAFLMGFFTKINYPLSLTAVQILWLNLVTDGFLDVGLSMEPKEPGLLKQVWLEKKQTLIDGALFFKTLYMAVPMGIGSLAVFLYYYQQDLMHARTMTLMTMAMFQWFNALNCRSMKRSLFSVGLFSNSWLIVIMAFVLSLQFALLYTPFMQHIFKTVPLSFNDWVVVIVVSAPIVLLDELRKVVVRGWSSN